MPGKISGYFGFLTYTFQNNLNVLVLKTIKLLIETNKNQGSIGKKKKAQEEENMKEEMRKKSVAIKIDSSTSSNLCSHFTFSDLTSLLVKFALCLTHLIPWIQLFYFFIECITFQHTIFIKSVCLSTQRETWNVVSANKYLWNE